MPHKDLKNDLVTDEMLLEQLELRGINEELVKVLRQELTFVARPLDETTQNVPATLARERGVR